MGPKGSECARAGQGRRDSLPGDSTGPAWSKQQAAWVAPEPPRGRRGAGKSLPGLACLAWRKVRHVPPRASQPPRIQMAWRSWRCAADHGRTVLVWSPPCWRGGGGRTVRHPGGAPRTRAAPPPAALQAHTTAACGRCTSSCQRATPTSPRPSGLSTASSTPTSTKCARAGPGRRQRPGLPPPLHQVLCNVLPTRQPPTPVHPPARSAAAPAGPDPCASTSSTRPGRPCLVRARRCQTLHSAGRSLLPARPLLPQPRARHP